MVNITRWKYSNEQLEDSCPEFEFVWTLDNCWGGLFGSQFMNTKDAQNWDKIRSPVAVHNDIALGYARYVHESKQEIAFSGPILRVTALKESENIEMHWEQVAENIMTYDRCLVFSM